MNNGVLTNLSTLGIGGQQINHFDSRDQDLLLHTHVRELWGLSVDRSRPGGKETLC